MSEVITEPTRSEQMRRQIADAKDAKIKLAAFDKLMSNREFKSVILDTFCVTECARYAQISGNQLLSESARADALSIAQAAGHLKTFLHSYGTQLANKASKLPEFEEDLELIEKEELEEAQEQEG
ncbi:hypothetical protein C121_82 [Stenotrophomonas phage C121]|uniref:hypothetical protein n=1 Tax=Stenotrophomonas phage C121 TaxID=2914029 RepID=UPI0023292762|nr:hypothetical protein PP752_gp82 [Stenotrophomonas phage C121]UKL14815.1 hypothetical protein C121_82 [Stenotrophomonas phage C121]